MDEIKQQGYVGVKKEVVSKQVIMQKTLNWFVISLLVATIGAAVGNSLDPSWFIPLVILEFALLIAAIVVRRSQTANRKWGIPLLLSFAFVTGLMTGPILTHFFSEGAGLAVLMAFVTASATFTILGFIGAKIKTDLHFLGKALFAALIILVLFALFSLFVPLGAMTTIIAGFGTLVFSLYILFDFNQIMKRDVTLDDVPMLALSLYLDFLNLFLYLLQLFTGGRD
ncbi:hypothetical protein MFLO_15483 [Listeria floridensis FSL S10-1187]|uniref:Uncharacterized protein n=1 Tax=Listeria floridensis FSL S10-1187 TaxID=1265817 RepID=A0ABN0RBG2_9LIST|nr:Bax inhibitor-1 family protein [Listeria floridensis]EUJ25392.1 hypothetical protein MFLO_15483 [Listeria floridensis FSL S10-1187]